MYEQREVRYLWRLWRNNYSYEPCLPAGVITITLNRQSLKHGHRWATNIYANLRICKSNLYANRDSHAVVSLWQVENELHSWLCRLSDLFVREFD